MGNVIQAGMIGCGYWGPNLLRNLVGIDSFSVKRVVDTDSKRRAYVSKNFPQSIEVTESVDDIFHDSSIEAVIISTPASSHYHLTRMALKANKHVFVEKPLALTVNEAIELNELAEIKNRRLMVGHTFLYNAAVNKLKQLIDSKEIGDVYYLYSKRLNLGIVRQDINVVWNLAPHDVSIILYLLQSLPTAVSATGVCYLQENIEDVAFCTLFFPNKISAHIHVSWLDPHKIRNMTVVGNKKMVLYDDVDSNKITIFDKGIQKDERVPITQPDDYAKFQFVQKTGDIHQPFIHFPEPISTELKAFANHIINNTLIPSDGKSGIDVVKVLCAISRSITLQGQTVALDDPSIL